MRAYVGLVSKIHNQKTCEYDFTLKFDSVFNYSFVYLVEFLFSAVNNSILAVLCIANWFNDVEI